jgi:hypothetical protein
MGQMRHVYTKFQFAYLKGRDYLKDLGMDEWILQKWCGKVWTGFIWLRTGTSGRLLWS